MLGHGIYLADKSSKSSQYISDNSYARHNISGSLMIVEASLGNVVTQKKSTDGDTVFGEKSRALKNNEWCVRNPKAVIPRYLVEMELL